MHDPGPRPLWSPLSGGRVDPSRGHVEVICGPMFSGKTEELIRRLRRAQIARQGVMVIKPSVDVRYDVTDIVSHSALRIPSVPVEKSAEIEPLVAAEGGRVSVVGIDEAQFFDNGLVEVVERLADRGLRVVVAGLDQDFLGRPFGPMAHLMCAAEVVTKQLSVCMVCGGPASKSQRVRRESPRPDAPARDPADERVLIGGEDAYEARCRRCYVQGVDVPSTPFSKHKTRGNAG